MANKNNTNFAKRARRVRFAIAKKAGGRLRLSVFRSNQHIYAQVIDDSKGLTIASAATIEKDLRNKLVKTSDTAAAEAVGRLVAERAIKAGADLVVFDKGAYLYHGKVKALADAARAAGLKF